MSRGSRIIPITAEKLTDDEHALAAESTPTGEIPDDPDAWDPVDVAKPAKDRSFAWILPLLVISGWSGFFVWSRQESLLAPATPAQWSEWIADWSVPVLLVCTLWLLVMRLSRREAARFGDVARQLRHESEALEIRLASVNAELSIAREFIAAQSRDLESLGRMAAERLSVNADKLASLIQSNGSHIDAIGSVSASALDNMEQLRGQLPVIASSAKDVSNNIANAGRSAQGQLQEMIQGFKRLNEFGQASERQVISLRSMIDSALAEFTSQANQLEEISRVRFEELAKSSETFRTHLDTLEIKVLAAIRSRAKALEDELGKVGAGLSEQESRSLAALTQRIADISQASAAFTDSLHKDLAMLDSDLKERQASHEEQSAQLAAHAESVADRLAALSPKLVEIGDHASTADRKLTDALVSLTGAFIAGKTELAGTESQLADLTDASVRLLEIIQASSQHSREDLPKAISTSDAALSKVESRILHLKSVLEGAGQDGNSLMESLIASGERLDEFTAQATETRTLIEGQEAHLAAMLSGLLQQVTAIGDEGRQLADTTRDDLATSIASLADAAREALAGIDDLSDDAIARLADRLGEASRNAVNKVLESHIAEAVSGIEQAAALASEVSHEAAVHLHDQLAKVNELAGNIERRVSHARSRAEEQINNDFSRRVALITESLNSHAIDIARALSTDVSDTAWAAYLKGDRGIFTRRAVSLVDTGEARAILNMFEADQDFREHVSRYIHDFEAMLRQLLSTRDGHALGVTLLSSDIGKLYVALAQSIERLRG